MLCCDEWLVNVISTQMPAPRGVWQLQTLSLIRLSYKTGQPHGCMLLDSLLTPVTVRAASLIGTLYLGLAMRLLVMAIWVVVRSKH